MTIAWSWLKVNRWNATMAFLVTFVAALAFTAIVIKVARARGLVAKPSSERWHRQPTALFGGVAIFLASLLSALLWLPLTPGVLSLGIGALIIFGVGVYDDLRPILPAHKFVAQLVAACFFVATFYSMTQPPDYVWLIPFAILWIVGMTNAFNLLDNMDGLSAGVAALAAALMAAHAVVAGDTTVAFSALILSGTAAGFLVFNFNPARIFMGDCGSMFLGFSLACLTLMGRSELLSGNLFTTLLLPTLALATPIFDTLFVTCVRMLHGRSISQGGRDHTSHRLVMLGLSERRAVCWLYAVTLWFGLVGLWGYIAQNVLAAIVVTVLSAIALLVLGVFLAEVQTYAEDEYELARARHRRDKAVLSRIILHKRRFVEALLDFGLICACWIAAFLLRFDGQLNEYTYTMSVALPYVAACQMTAFHALGLYRSLWQYVTISDISAAGWGVVVGTLASAVMIACFAPLKAFPWSTLVIYGVLLLLAVVGLRVGLRVLRFHFALRWREGLKRVLVIGAGNAGELAVREMLHNRALHLQPVGFLDDDPAKQRATIHGVRVLGPRSQLLDVVQKMNIDEVIIAMPSIGNGVVQEVIDTCGEHGIHHREVRGVIL
jgi:UDP-GlcNAc:undecaprenyl-phosphate/decaprenyl-phosphate GlcNAc-1-phosphate transferase